MIIGTIRDAVVRCGIFVPLCLCLSSHGTAQVELQPKQAAEDKEFESLLDEKSLDHWKHVFPDDAAAEAQGNWTLAKGQLSCRGKPLGYLRTKQKFANYVLRLKWRYTKAAKGNSGVLLHIQEPDKVWPQCFQVQLLTDEAGSIFPLEGAKSDNRTNSKGPCRELGDWNDWEIVFQDAKITLSIKRADGQTEQIGTITGCEPRSGYVGLQSEGSEIEFREVLIKKLP